MAEGLPCVLLLRLCPPSASQIESALIEHPAVAEAAVVAVPHSIKGEAVYCFVTNKQGTEWSDQLKKELILKGRWQASVVGTGRGRGSVDCQENH